MGELRTQLEAEQKRMEMREMDDRGQNSRLQQKNRCADDRLRLRWSGTRKRASLLGLQVLAFKRVA